MKKKYFICLSLAVLMLTSLSALAINPASEKNLPVSAGLSTAVNADNEKVLETRFLNMLNHSFAYDKAFDSEEALVNCAVLALLDKHSDDSSIYVSATEVSGYLHNMYGVEIDDFSRFNTAFPQKDGYVYVIPRGFSLYKHTAPKVTVNEDGTYSVLTDVSIESHDGSETAKAVTLFVKNKNSVFGYNIVSSEIISETSDI